MNENKPDYAGRLLRLAATLDEWPPERFDFGLWVGQDWKGSPDLSCGTTACGLGIAATMPEFQALGMRLFRESSGAGAVTVRETVARGAFEESMHAACVVFGIDADNFDFVFTPRDTVSYESYDGDGDPDGEPIYDDENKLPTEATAKQLAEHIRKFVKGKWGAR